MSMDIVEFVNKMSRMCSKYPDCVGCPIETENEDEDCLSKVPAEQMVDIVEQWAREHPIKTRQSEFLKMFPNVMRNNEGQPYICPRTLDTVYQPDGDCALDVDICQRCRAKFWGQVVE